MLKVKSGQRDILLVNAGNTFYALNNRCPHMGGSLADGRLEGTAVTCPRHGSSFDVRTGKVLQDPHLLFIKMKVSDTIVYPIRIEGEKVLVGLD